jgi:acetyltransferase-like isoleucine patch superfamily enzyme
MSVYNFILSILKRFKKIIVLNSYDDYSIADYFRSQGAQIGEDCFFSIRELANEPYLVKIGNHVGIAANVRLITHNLGWCFRDEIPDLQGFGTITIEDNCNIGPFSILLPGVRIMRNSIIGAGSVVTKDVPPNSIAAGNPAKVIASVDKYKAKAIELWGKQKPEGYLSDLKPGVEYKGRDLHRLFALPHNRKLLKEHLIEYFKPSTNNHTN